MPHYQSTNNKVEVFGQNYSLCTQSDKPFVNLFDRRGKRLAELFYLSSVHPLHGRDDTLEVEPWEINETPEEIVLSMAAGSSIWDRKIYRFRCFDHRLVYEVEVQGTGQLSEVQYFGGYYSGQVRWGSGFFFSGQYFQRGFTPEPNTEEENYFSPGEGVAIDLMGVPLPGRANWFFTPPPFLFAFQSELGWLGMGVESKPGENLFTEYAYHGRRPGFHLSLAYEGHTRVSGSCVLPAIGIDFAPDEYEVLAAHIKALEVNGCVPVVDRRHRPAWWQEPIFCGWGSQCYAAALEKGKAPDFSRQSLYEEFLNQLDANDVSPGIVVLDDKWQEAYGENQIDGTKWPDLPGFIQRQHARGRRVLLWLKAWDPEGIPAEECITNAHGLPLAVDPSNPAFEERLRRSVRRMLSAEGYNADGFKIDFTARIPSGPGIRTYGEAWGLELMKLYLAILYQEAKRVKPDALVMTHTPHPYLTDVLDMVRLNDINLDKDVNQAMTLRYKIASLACPGAIIDTDNWPIKDKASWQMYLQIQPTLGVPSLYYATHIDATREPLTDQDYALIRSVWAEHRRRIAGQQDRESGEPGDSKDSQSQIGSPQYDEGVDHSKPIGDAALPTLAA